jgi:hypothetical protein
MHEQPDYRMQENSGKRHEYTDDSQKDHEHGSPEVQAGA